MTIRRALLPALGFAGFAACTPIGLWVWEEPAFEVARVRLGQATPADSAVAVALYVWNPNDYDLSTERFELSLQLDGHTVGHYARDSIIPISQRAADTLTLTFLPAAATRRRFEGSDTGTHRFAVEGHAVLSTPFGARPVKVAHAGDIAFGGYAQPARGRKPRKPPPGVELPDPEDWPTSWRDWGRSPR